MNAKHLITLAGLAAVMAGLATWSSRKEIQKTEAASLGSKAFPSLQTQVNEITSIRIQSPAETATVTRVGGIWRVPGKWNYPADFGKIRDLLRKLADTKILQAVRTTPAERGELQLLTSADTGATNREQCATRIQLLDSQGSAISSLYLGKTRSRPGPESGMGGFPDSQFVMTEKGQASLIGDTFPEVTTRDKDWLDTDFLALTDIIDIHVAGKPTGEIHATRATPADDLKVQGTLPENKEVDATKLSSLGSALSFLKFDDLVDPKLPPEKTGLDKPVIYKATSKKGEKITLRIGKSPAGDTKRYASVSVAFEAPSLPAPSGSDTNQAALAQAREKENTQTAASTKLLNDKFSPWIYLLSPETAETITQGFHDILKDKPKPQDQKENVK
jgi:hypothetical protein